MDICGATTTADEPEHELVVCEDDEGHDGDHHGFVRNGRMDGSEPWLEIWDDGVFTAVPMRLMLSWPR